MPRFSLRQLALPALALSLAAGCADDEHEHPADDAGLDTAHDSGHDADHDATTDAGSDAESDADQGMAPVAIRFALRAGDAAVGCGDTLTLGADDTAFDLSDARFYVHDVYLTSPHGDAQVMLTPDATWQYDTVALLDFEDGTGACANGNALTNDVVVGEVPRGHYTGLRFTVGVPFELNHDDVATAPAPLNYSAMFWNWQGGYKFVRIEGTNVGAGVRLHLGSTMCEGTAGDISGCGRPNRPEVVLDGFDPASDVVVLDLAALWAETTLGVNTPETAPGCMSGADDPDCEAVFGTLGIDAEGLPTGTQTAFVAVDGE